MIDRPFYVYQYSCPTTNTPFYIGKGKGNRSEHHVKIASKNPTPQKGKHFLNTIRKILREGKYPIITIIETNLTETQAYDLEKKLIIDIGRKDIKTGPLLNLTNGGEGGAISPNILKDSHNTPEYIKSASERMVQYWDDSTKRLKQSKTIKQTFSKPNRIKANSIGTKNSWTNNDVRTNRIASLKLFYENPNNSKVIAERHSKISNKLKTTSSFVVNNPKSKAVVTPYGIFKSINAAFIHALTIEETTAWKFRQRFNTKSKEYYFDDP